MSRLAEANSPIRCTWKGKDAWSFDFEPAGNEERRTTCTTGVLHKVRVKDALALMLTSNRSRQIAIILVVALCRFGGSRCNRRELRQGPRSRAYQDAVHAGQG